MATITLTQDTFDTVVEQDGITLVDWWATWCPPCQSFGPVFEAASEKHADIRFGKIDIDVESQLASGANIMSVPTLMAFRDGILVFEQPGALPAAALEQLIEAVRALDMEEVRKAQVA
jgi:thioredoxin 1